MGHEYHQATGDIVPPRDLAVEKARDLALRLSANEIDFASLVECRTDEAGEVVVFDVSVEVPQRPVYPIRPRERIAVTFDKTDRTTPKVEALRTDFPLVPHLNLHIQEHPRSICLYEERYDSVKRRWTAPRFVHCLQRWLARNARGELHQDDQPLEPFLIGYAGHIILPHDLGDAKGDSEHLYVTAHRSSASKPCFLIAQREPPSENALPFVASIHRCQPQVHGTIHRRPSTLADLARLVTSVGLDLLQEIRDRLKGWKSENESLLDSNLIHILQFPRTRTEGGDVERIDTWAFVLDGTLRDIGVKLGIWEEQGGQLGILLDPELSKRGEDIRLDVLNPSYELTRPVAALLNGRSLAGEPQIAAVGVGALGSQVVMNLARSGFGTWTLIDDDRFMPHNAARHALYPSFVGWHKAETVAFLADSILADSTSFSSLPVNVLAPGARGKDLAAAFEAADIILDMSADVSVARTLACDTDGFARRVSLFLTPTGRDLVVLAEDECRCCGLDALEMQYYRAMANNRQLVGLATPAGSRHRYGQACRDITSTLPQNLVALHAAIAADVVQRLRKRRAAMIAVWRADDTGQVHRVGVRPWRAIRHTVNSWTVVTDGNVLQRLHRLRKRKLPNETGGVLLGSFDLDRRILYIVDTVPSPPDSEEWPTLYIRGRKGLRGAVDAVTDKTDGMLEYVGEWHSHPKGVRTTPGDDDSKVFAWLTERMATEGLPGVMMIVGDRCRTSCFVGEIPRRENLLPRPTCEH